MRGCVTDRDGTADARVGGGGRADEHRDEEDADDDTRTMRTCDHGLFSGSEY